MLRYEFSPFPLIQNVNDYRTAPIKPRLRTLYFVGSKLGFANHEPSSYSMSLRPMLHLFLDG